MAYYEANEDDKLFRLQSDLSHKEKDGCRTRHRATIVRPNIVGVRATRAGTRVVFVRPGVAGPGRCRAKSCVVVCGRLNFHVLTPESWLLLGVAMHER